MKFATISRLGFLNLFYFFVFAIHFLSGSFQVLQEALYHAGQPQPDLSKSTSLCCVQPVGTLGMFEASWADRAVVTFMLQCHANDSWSCQKEIMCWIPWGLSNVHLPTLGDLGGICLILSTQWNLTFHWILMCFSWPRSWQLPGFHEDGPSFWRWAVTGWRFPMTVPRARLKTNRNSPGALSVGAFHGDPCQEGMRHGFWQLQTATELRRLCST